MIMYNNPPNDPVDTVETAFGILETVLENEGATLTSLSNELGIAKSTVHRHVQTLVYREYLVHEDGQYHIGLRFLEYGKHAQTRKHGYQMVAEKVRDLAVETDERAQFMVEEFGQAVYVYREIGSRAVQTDPGVGRRIPIHTTSAGKAILAHIPREQVETIIERRGLPAVTEYTTTDRETLFEELEQIRERGFSINRQENVVGLHAVGAPVTGPEGDVLGALSISGPSHRLKGDQLENEVPDLLLGTVNELELNVFYS
jgi:DNA-binding IclR family transcriptional regulator